MACNFHDINGILLIGIDRHFALLLPGVPVPFIPTPVPVMTKLNFLHPFVLGDKQRGTVFFNGVNAVAHWHQPKFLWPHLGLPPFPFDILTPLQILLGVQTCWLPKTDVLAEGEPCTPCAIFGPLSINLDCWDFANIPSSLILQVGTVQTSPSLADYMAGLKAVAIDFAMNIAFNLLLRGAGKLLARGARAASRAVASRVVARARPRGRMLNAVRNLFGAEKRRLRDLARRNSLNVPHSVQKGPTCQMNSLGNQMRFRDPGRALSPDDILRQAQAKGMTKKPGLIFGRRGDGMSQYNAAMLAHQNGWNVGTNQNASWAEIKNLVDQGKPVGTAVPVNWAGNPAPGGDGWHAVIVKGHFTDGGNEYAVVTHSWPGAETKVWSADTFNQARDGYIYWLNP